MQVRNINKRLLKELPFKSYSFFYSSTTSFEEESNGIFAYLLKELIASSTLIVNGVKQYMIRKCDYYPQEGVATALSSHRCDIQAK
ncbi:hypothetical protein NQ317_014616 [Molorchus minor]|uniref:Uncharacterized protein n=1 Tax=Molorchus minor TaxID=1323400 RepID=A0ABQ9IQ42_9CUCU|nr:hypothetical protein NQ317_014616 [Molorchus minor]